ncbi:ectoine/hydroxyectoine ABC transporter permease subunit EhuD [Mycolicibacterium smegmatis]|uniref:Ectoine/hydroxyectoine ABC transporter, permease protein EhuD n=1 Tax=Mycolicibacterium smegmatis (strain MKD8) TaxID=1214915 RepID=A0A2U9PTA0_MYCSE|nr:ectoine/hydroxyectoine ABC transporter permease subunit EhuD [Mycolicibacterium smegmatis]AWT54525.1 ectoine/hydroxyectoine ABC transporter, permease protein EhuD [Mycolicibacterium smegmatis MKD8]MDF1903347.1 ectoine/hydroxyectoine ABC transporter permease subunit EhuD [Mycolicibacterium smegmatis]MDF1904481.1 ectoine/hydroxyectoine ABC transporter permease subunit EhuD [Mycolicibacterium smegmatis]MDF1918350.1 ectoine/hydroxyectoine ABC transporter permease subunit EhuD [Mycolicibacterium 
MTTTYVAAQIWDNQFALEIFPKLLDAFWLTIRLTIVGMAIALVLGLFVAVIRYPRIPVVSQLFDFYVLFVRGTPLLVQIFAVYFILPEYGITLSNFTAGVLVLGINYSAYTAEVYRAGIEALPKGQWEAATALNLSRARTWSRIVLPQSIAMIIPVLGNYLIQMFKDTALLYAIGTLEVLTTARSIGQSTGQFLEPLTIAGLMYLIISYVSSLAIRQMERRYAPVH